MVSTLNLAIHALLFAISPHKSRVTSISKISSTSTSSSLPISQFSSINSNPKSDSNPQKSLLLKTQNPIPASTMNNTVLETEKNPNHKPKISSFFSPKLYIYIVIICVLIFILFQIQILSTPPSQTSPSSSSSSSSSWFLFHQKWRENTETDFSMTQTCKSNFKTMVSKLRSSITFLPLKDLRYTSTALQGHTWFISSMFDQQIEGEVQFQKYPSESSNGRLLCIKGNDTHDGSWNSYGFAYPEALPTNATYKPGLTFISYNHYNYDNIWHGLSALVPFVAWHRRMGGCAVPSRWILYHWGELRKGWGGWVGMLMEAAFGVDGIRVETLDEIGVDGTVCFEEVVVMRHNEGGMNRDRRLEVYDLLRCKARVYCNVSLEGRGAEVNEKGLSVIGMTMFMRTGARSFKNQSAVIEIFEKECAKVEECRFRAAYSNNLTFCEQVSLMSSTDILISPHGAQLTNMFFMDRNSSVLEFFPKGWLKLAGVGQYVYHWIASWSGMKHQGAWRDPNGEHCEFSEDDRRCFSIYKSGMIGHNETQFSEWASNVLNEVKKTKQEEQDKEKASTSKKPRTKQELMEASGCACG